MFNIITPLARIENYQKQLEMLEPMGIKWHIITDKDKKISIPARERRNWISFYVCPNIIGRFYERCNYSINWFLSLQLLIESEYYLILNDDDAYPSDFFAQLKLFIDEFEKDVSCPIICSMLRGHQIPSDVAPERQHPTSALIAMVENLRVGKVGIEQLIARGDILKRYRIPMTVTGDGNMIVSICQRHGAIFLPNIFVLFNYFEPGRWDMSPPK